MKREKLAVSIPSDDVRRVRALVRRGESASVSAYIARALAHQLEADSLETILDEMDAASGKPGKEHAAWARRVLAR